MPVVTVAQPQQKPNIVLFMVDDMGWQETSVPFWKERTPLNNRYRTPNMERLAAKGVKFMQAYACAVSSPSRCSLITGMNAARHGVTNWTITLDHDTNEPGSSLVLPHWNYNGVQPEGTTNPNDLRHSVIATPLPELLRKAGYRTIHVGKAHFAATETSGENPLNLGFDRNVAGAANGAPASYLASENYGKGVFHVIGLDEYAKKGTFLTEALTIEAVREMREAVADSIPFFLYMSHYAIHVPYDADDRFVSNYMQADGKGVFDEMLGEHLNRQEINHAALVEGMDKSLGDIMDYLDEAGIADNTIIIFMSDNGGQGIHVRQGQWNYAQNYPARAGKGSAYEGGVHEPMIVYWNGVTKGGTTTQQRVMIEDFYPTLLDMAGADDRKTIQTIDGVSFMHNLVNPKSKKSRTIVWHYPNRWIPESIEEEGYGLYSAIMKDNYHLIYMWENQELRLYDVKKDIAEQNNLVSKKRSVVKKLAKELTDSLLNYKAERPKFQSGEFVPWPDGRK